MHLSSQPIVPADFHSKVVNSQNAADSTDQRHNINRNVWVILEVFKYLRPDCNNLKVI